MSDAVSWLNCYQEFALVAKMFFTFHPMWNRIRIDTEKEQIIQRENMLTRRVECGT